VPKPKQRITSGQKQQERFTGMLFRLALRDLSSLLGAVGKKRDIPNYPRMGKKPEILDDMNVWRAPDAKPSDRPELRTTPPASKET
jgi:hypothetical protein